MAIGGIAWWLHALHFESTDDAFIDTRIATISSHISGTVTELAVTDNQQRFSKGTTARNSQGPVRDEKVTDTHKIGVN